MTEPGLTETQVDRAVVRVMERDTFGRKVENWLAIAGVTQAMFAGTIESLVNAGVKFGECRLPPEHWWQAVPWFNLAILAICVLPKAVGRATAGKVWEAIAARVSGGKAPS